MEFRVLGPVQVATAAGTVELASGKQVALLACLLVARGDIVSRDRLIDALWGEQPPAAAVNALQVHVHGLRRRLGPERIELHGPGYRLRLAPGELDLERFELLVARGRAELSRGEAGAAESSLREALGLCLGAALRRTRNAPPVATAVPPAAPGVIVLDQALQPVSWTAGARGWVDAMPAAPVFAMWGVLPPVIYPAAALARTRAPSHALERAVDGRWIRIEAAALEGADDGRIAIVLRSATSAETFALLCRAYALTRRERELVAALVAGLDTRALTEHLVISRHTVQDHLKSIFDKVGVRSRRELLATFSASAEPARS